MGQGEERIPRGTVDQGIQPVHGSVGSLGPAGVGDSGRAPGMEGNSVGLGFGMDFPSPNALG